MGQVIGDLLAYGMSLYWDCVPALAVGAPHLRDRVWIVAYRYDIDADFPPPKVTRKNPGGYITDLHKLPRAGAAKGMRVWECEPRATVKMCKEAMGAEKKDGVTWLTKLDMPLLPSPSPSPSAVSYGSNHGGAAGRVGPVRHSLEQMARHRLWPTAHGLQVPAKRFAGPSGNELGHAVNRGAEREQGLPLTPTPTVNDSRNGRNATANRNPDAPGSAHSGTTLSDFIRMWPTTSAAAAAAQGPGRQGRDGGPNLVTAIAEEQVRLYPTARSSPNENRGHGSYGGQGVTHGQTLIGAAAAAEIAEGREIPPGNNGAGPLSPDWTEWLMQIPVGWTDLDCDHPVLYDHLSEYGIPRVKRDVPRRRKRLQAIGNALVHGVASVIIEDALARIR